MPVRENSISFKLLDLLYAFEEKKENIELPLNDIRFCCSHKYEAEKEYYQFFWHRFNKFFYADLNQIARSAILSEIMKDNNVSFS